MVHNLQGLNGKDPLESTREELLIEHDFLREKLLSMVEAMKGRQLIEKLESIEVVIQRHNKVIAEQSATIMEQNAQINEHRRRVGALEDTLRLSKEEKVCVRARERESRNRKRKRKKGHTHTSEFISASLMS
jgi:hypothetical protein